MSEPETARLSAISFYFPEAARMRTRNRVRNDDLQLDLFGASLPSAERVAAETVDTLRLPGRESWRNRLTEEQIRPDSGRLDRGGRDPTADRPGMGASGEETYHSPAGKVADNIVVLPAPVHEPEQLRNQNNYRITDADRVGTGSLKQKCRDNLAAVELLKRLEAE